MPEDRDPTDETDGSGSTDGRGGQRESDRSTANGDAPPADPIAREDTPPRDVVEAAERLTRRAREAVDEAAADAYLADRDERLAAHDYAARVREDDTRDVLVLYPAAWLDDGTVRTERVEDVDRGIEVPLSGPGEGDDWETIDAHNRDLAAAVREAHGDVHGANAAALADFMSNHYAKPIESATRGELAEFLEEYFPRNAWPSEAQRAVVRESVELTFDAADERCPLD